MRNLLISFIIFFCLINISQAKTHSIQMSLSDTFTISDDGPYNVEVERLLTVRFADVVITPKNGNDFDLKLFFKCDTPDLAKFDSLQKMKQSVMSSSKEYLSYIIEKQIRLKELYAGQAYGAYTVMTDASLADVSIPPKDEFKYMVRGMVRTSKNTALGFSLMINELDSPLYKELFDYILSFIKEK